MKQQHVASVDQYIAAQPAAARAVLEQVRNTIRRVVPRAHEVISYQIPAYRLPGLGTVIHFAGWTRHYSLYPVTAHMVDDVEGAASYTLNDRGTIRFPLGEPVPLALIRRIVRRRVKAIETAVARGGRAKTTRTRTRPVGKRPTKAVLKAIAGSARLRS